MKKETLYLDTSVPSAYFDDRTKERQEATITFWRKVLPLYQVYISGITVEELEATKNEFLRRNFKTEDWGVWSTLCTSSSVRAKEIECRKDPNPLNIQRTV